MDDTFANYPNKRRRRSRDDYHDAAPRMSCLTRDQDISWTDCSEFCPFDCPYCGMMEPRSNVGGKGSYPPASIQERNDLDLIADKHLASHQFYQFDGHDSETALSQLLTEQQLQVLGIRMDDRTRERQSCLDALNGAPTTELCQLTLSSRLEWSLPLPVLTRVLRRSHLLSSMRLHSISFEGTKEDFDDFCDSFRNLPSLKEVHLVDCCLIDQSIPLDPLLRTLAVIPTMESVEIYAMDLARESSVSLMSPESLGALCRSPTITTLSLQDLELNDEHVQEIASALKDNEAMKSLTLWDCNVSDQGGEALASMLEVNTPLEKMDLSFNDLSNAAYTAIATALHTNETLWSLSLHGNCSQLTRKQPGNRNNGRRETLPQRCTTSSRGHAALLQALKEGHNQVLKELILDTQEDPHIALHLAINRNRLLLQDDGVQRIHLADCLSRYNGSEGRERNLSFVYYLLQNKPELCNVRR